MTKNSPENPAPAWYDKYRVDYGDLGAPAGGKVTVFDFSSVRDIPPEDWQAVLEVERRELAARPEALRRAEMSKYQRVDMPVYTLRDGNNMPAVGLGTWKAERGQVRSAVHVALQAGYRHIDCASVYQNEDEVGDALHHAVSRGLVDRSELFICSKVWNNDHAPDRLRAACLRSLKALKLDYLDLYLIHWPVTGNTGDEVRPSIKETWEAMEALVRDGLVKSIGTSNFSAKKLEAIMEYATIPPAVCQVEAHPYHRNDALLEWCGKHNIHFTAFSPLGSPDSESIFPRKIPAVLLEDPTVQAVAKRTGRNAGQVLIRWALQRGTSVIPKSTNPDRLRGNLDVLSWQLSAEDFAALNAIKFQQRMVNGSLWLNPKGPYKTMQDLWDEPELVPRDEDYPRRVESVVRHAAKYESITNMPSITLRDGNRMPAVGLGTWKAEKGQVRDAVHVALEAGYRHIDCASVYQNEDEVGDALHHALSQGLVDRSELYICSKVWNNDHAPERVRAACLRSLKALKVDYLDLYLIHFPVTGNVGDEVLPSIKDTWSAMESLVRDGLVKSIGTSNFSANKLAAIMEYAEIQPAVCQAEAHPYHRNDALIAWCAKQDIHFTAYSPLGSPDSESIFPRKIPAVLLEDPTVRAIAKRTGRNAGQVLIRWALQRGTSVIPKSTNPDRLRGNLDVLDWELNAADFSALSSIRFQQRMVNGAMWLNPKGPYKTMEDLWDEPELVPKDEDYPGNAVPGNTVVNEEGGGVSSPLEPSETSEPSEISAHKGSAAESYPVEAEASEEGSPVSKGSPRKGGWRSWLGGKSPGGSPKKGSKKDLQ